MDYNAPSGSADPNAGYVGATPTTQGSRIPPKAAEYPQREIVAAVKAAGIPPSNSDTTQLSQALARGVWLGAIGQIANANDLTAAIPGALPWPVILTGMEFQGTIAAPNTGSMTLNLSGSVAPLGKLALITRGGGALQANDVPAGIPFRFRYDGTQFRLSGAVPSETAQAIAASTRIVLRANLNVYVNIATGSDTNNGLTPTTAFATIQGAVNALIPAYDTAGYAITVNVAPGNYASVVIDQAAALKLNFLGNTGNSSLVTVTSPNTQTPCFAVKRGSRINVQGFTLAGVGNGLDANNLGQIEYGYITFANQGYNCSAFYLSQLTQLGPVTIGNSCQAHVYSGNQSSINIAFATVSFPPTGTVTFGTAFAIANNGTILANGLTLAYTGNSAGPRYQASFGGRIFVAGAGPNVLPGNSAGSVDASSTYQ